MHWALDKDQTHCVTLYASYAYLQNKLILEAAETHLRKECLRHIDQIVVIKTIKMRKQVGMNQCIIVRTSHLRNSDRKNASGKRDQNVVIKTTKMRKLVGMNQCIIVRTSHLRNSGRKNASG